MKQSIKQLCNQLFICIGYETDADKKYWNI